VAPYTYSASDHNGMTGAFIGIIKNGVIVKQGPVQVTGTSSTGAVTTYSGTQATAPSSGMP
jgi:hypothetical protein